MQEMRLIINATCFSRCSRNYFVNCQESGKIRSFWLNNRTKDVLNVIILLVVHRGCHVLPLIGKFYHGLCILY